MQLCSKASSILAKIAPVEMLSFEQLKLFLSEKMLLLQVKISSSQANLNSHKHYRRRIFMRTREGTILPRTSNILAMSEITPLFVGVKVGEMSKDTDKESLSESHTILKALG